VICRPAAALPDGLGEGEPLEELEELALEDDGVVDPDGEPVPEEDGAEDEALPAFTGDIAFCWNCRKDLSGVALMAKTMPF